MSNPKGCDVSVLPGSMGKIKFPESLPNPGTALSTIHDIKRLLLMFGIANSNEGGRKYVINNSTKFIGVFEKEWLKSAS